MIGIKIIFARKKVEMIVHETIIIANSTIRIFGVKLILTTDVNVMAFLREARVFLYTIRNHNYI